MNGFFRYLLFLGTFWPVIISCDSLQAPDCLKKTGEIVSKQVDPEPFHTIVVMDETDLYLGNATEQQVVIRAGKNLIPDIHIEVADSVMTIRNDNRCNWRRSPGNPGIYIQSNRLRNIEIYDFANIYTQDTLSLEKLILFSDGTGNFELSLEVDTLLVTSTYVSNFRLTGNAGFLEINFGNDGRFDGKDLLSEINLIHHNGSNLIELWPVKELSGELGSTGNLCYYHKPEFLDIKVNHTGLLIDCSE